MDITTQLPDATSPATTEQIITTTSMTHNGQRLSPKEDRFIALYIKLSDATEAAKQAGYTVRDGIKNTELAYRKRGVELLSRDYIKDEIAYRLEEFRDAQIADAKEVMMYLTSVMRGEEKDQFGLDVSISDRTTAAKELNRRLHELESAAQTEGKEELRIVLERR